MTAIWNLTADIAVNAVIEQPKDYLSLLIKYEPIRTL